MNAGLFGREGTGMVEGAGKVANHTGDAFIWIDLNIHRRCLSSLDRSKGYRPGVSGEIQEPKKAGGPPTKEKTCCRKGDHLPKILRPRPAAKKALRNVPTCGVSTGFPI
jgi:hypothetical protein